jgi:uridine phosphorylase
MSPKKKPIIAQQKAYDQPSVFLPENLLREARRQKSIARGAVPKICVLDPDGDILDRLLRRDGAQINEHWACYHTKLYDFELDGITYGIIACAVGAPYAVLLAEELFVSGCELLISITSSGQIVHKREPPFYVLIEKALRDEGTSYHYLPPAEFSHLDEKLLTLLGDAFAEIDIPVLRGTTWTTDAPFRETQQAIDRAKSMNIDAVEMESAALYAFSKARSQAVVCFAHVTNQMANIEGDFEKGEAAGSRDSLRIISLTGNKWMSAQ